MMVTPQAVGSRSSFGRHAQVTLFERKGRSIALTEARSSFALVRAGFE